MSRNLHLQAAKLQMNAQIDNYRGTGFQPMGERASRLRVFYPAGENPAGAMDKMSVPRRINILHDPSERKEENH